MIKILNFLCSKIVKKQEKSVKGNEMKNVRKGCVYKKKKSVSENWKEKRGVRKER
jgi:hypothetical protein